MKYDNIYFELGALRRNFREKICIPKRCMFCNNQIHLHAQCNFESLILSSLETKFYFLLSTRRDDLRLDEKEMFSLMFEYPHLIKSYNVEGRAYLSCCLPGRYMAP